MNYFAVTFLFLALILSLAPAGAQQQSDQILFNDSGQRLGNSISESVELGDLNGDGALDALVASGEEAPARIWLNDGAGNFRDGGSVGQQYDPPMLPGDVNGDGALDMVGLVFSHFRVMINNGSGEFSVIQNELFDISLGSGIGSSLGDLDNDGDLDYFFEQQVFLNNGGVFSPAPFPGSQGFTSASTLGDLDSDGDLDVFAVTFRGNRILLNNGNGSFVLAQELAADDTAVALGDFDRDGDLDAVTGNLRGGLQTWINDGAAVFSLGQRFTQALSSQTVSVADLNGDTAVDIVLTDTAYFQTFRNDGSGAFSPGPFNYAGANLQYTASALGDLNGDGIQDLFVATLNPFADSSAGGEQVWFNNTVQLPPAPLPAAALQPDVHTVQIGSTVGFQGSRFPADTTVALQINGQSPESRISQELGVDAQGKLAFRLDTSGADPGFYVVTLTGSALEQPVSSSFILAAAAPAHNAEDDGSPLFGVPGDSAAELHQTWLPIIQR